MHTKPADMPSKAEMDFWREWSAKAPALLHSGAAEIRDHVQNNPPPKNTFKTASIAVGAVLGAATLTKWVRGGWKWATGLGGAGLVASGLYIGGKFDEVMNAVKHTMPEFAKALDSYADGLEKDPKLRDQLADYLSKHISAEEIQTRGLDNVVAGKALEFGTSTPFLDLKAIGTSVGQEMKKNNFSSNAR